MIKMEAVLHVKVSLEEATIQSIGKLFTACLGGAQSAPKPLPTTVETRPAMGPRPAVPEKPAGTKSEDQVGTKSEDQVGTKSESAPAPKAPEIDNMTLNKAVKDAQGRGVEADVIRGVFAKYGIKSSRDCPADKRAALLSELNALQPDMPE